MSDLNLNSNKNNNIRLIQKLILYIRSLKPIILSHHPNCKEFKEHTFKIGKYRFCIGCFIGYPVAIMGVLLIFFLNLISVMGSTLLFTTGIILMSTFLLSPLKFTRIKVIKIVQKILFNLGGAFLFWWIFTLPNHFFINFLLFFLIFGIALALVNAYHAFSLYRTCKKCEFSLDWENCPGFKLLFEYCKANNLPNLFDLSKKNERNS
ncbi:MAG: hypothetical protein ACFFB0_11355 [Promethearchaeota archaeon]